MPVSYYTVVMHTPSHYPHNACYPVSLSPRCMLPNTLTCCQISLPHPREICCLISFRSLRCMTTAGLVPQDTCCPIPLHQRDIYTSLFRYPMMHAAQLVPPQCMLPHLVTPAIHAVHLMISRHETACCPISLPLRYMLLSDSFPHDVYMLSHLVTLQYTYYYYS